MGGFNKEKEVLERGERRSKMEGIKTYLSDNRISIEEETRAEVGIARNRGIGGVR